MKKPASIQLSIPKPCTQAWDEMRSEPGGKFCGHCQQTVTDFTGMSDAALLAYVQRNGLGCGRFLDGQLERVIVTPALPLKSYWKQLVAGVAAMIALLSKMEGAKAAEKSVVVNADTVKVPMAEVPVSIDTFTIRGIVKDVKGIPIMNAHIFMNRDSSISNVDGHYSIKVAGIRGQRLYVNCRHGNQEFSGEVQILERVIDFNIEMNAILCDPIPMSIKTGGYDVRKKRTFFQKLQFWHHYSK